MPSEQFLVYAVALSAAAGIVGGLVSGYLLKRQLEREKRQQFLDEAFGYTDNGWYPFRGRMLERIKGKNLYQDVNRIKSGVGDFYPQMV